MPSHKNESLQAEMLAQLKKVMDPELGVSLVDLGLIYETSLSKEGIAHIKMTLTTMGCPLFPVIEKDIENHLMEIEEVNDVKIELTFDPPWNPSMMTDEAKATPAKLSYSDHVIRDERGRVIAYRLRHGGQDVGP